MPLRGCLHTHHTLWLGQDTSNSSVCVRGRASTCSVAANVAAQGPGCAALHGSRSRYDFKQMPLALELPLLHCAAKEQGC